MADIKDAYKAMLISTAGTFNVKQNAGKLHLVTVNSKGIAGSTITLYDALTAIGSPFAIIDATIGGTFIYDIALNIGLVVVVAGATPPHLTISYL